ncbi:Asp23/Gls24 family envelope stress response protein [Amycolatopsis sp. NPDC049691]|uniref:Asp23/Gls24 family envelope stress response protein n=1 Tax=Amycolatopsis sp. NPDC049691 TaxID=3155155 RepID=UPI0034418D58
MAMTDYELPCERDVEHVWERLDAVGAGLADEHELTCPHCRAARESLLALRDATAELAAEDDVPPALFGRIMSAVRAEVRRGSTVGLPTPEPGFVEISEQAVAAVLRYAADTVDGVRARRCRIRTLAEGGVEVELTLAVSLRNATGGAALTLVRERVSAAAAARVGLLLAKLDLLVDDVYGEPGE